jgi:hypothetical protein
MSTRAHIAFYSEKDQPLKDWDALIYKHSDGYPEGTLPLLKEFCEAFNKQRGLEDSEYASARYVARLATERDEQLAEYRNPIAMEEFDFLGIGISKQLHGDIEYFYAVFPNRIEVYRLNQDSWEFKKEDGTPSNRRTLDGYVFILEEKIELSTS